MTNITGVSQLLSDWLFPNYCLQCHALVHQQQGLCEHCLQDLSLLDLSAGKNLLHRPDILELFPDCQFERLIACAWYRPPFDHWLTQLKFHNQIHYKKALGQIINQQLAVAKQSAKEWPDYFVILPLHRQRFFSRGFNQVDQVWRTCLADEVICDDLLVKCKTTSKQTNLTRAKRIKNLQGAFRCNKVVTGDTVAIVDDVMTSGATLNAATEALKQAGAKQVWAFVTCLTPLEH